MALTFDFTRCENSQELIGKPVTDMMIWLTMHVGIRTITEDNAEEFFQRVNFYETIFGAFLSRTAEDGSHTDSPITLADVKRHIGLNTNASTKTRAQFSKTLVESLWHDCKRRCRDQAAEKQEVAA